MVLLQPGESWAGPITADDGDGESVIVNVTFANWARGQKLRRRAC
jgi:hypothetical protein